MLKGLILSDKTNFLFTLKQHFVQLKLIVHLSTTTCIQQIIFMISNYTTSI